MLSGVPYFRWLATFFPDGENVVRLLYGSMELQFAGTSLAFTITRLSSLLLTTNVAFMSLVDVPSGAKCSFGLGLKTKLMILILV